MYDRKTWVILALCGSLLAVNLYFQAQEATRLRAIEEAKPKNLTPPPSEPALVPASGMSVEAPPPPTEEETAVLENDDVIFTFTNIGGGIKYAEFKKEFQVGSKTALVQHNHFGAGPIGGLAGPGELLENIAYSINAEESVAGSKIVYIAKLRSGLIAKKTFSLVKDDKPGSRYLLNFDLTLDAAATNGAFSSARHPRSIRRKLPIRLGFSGMKAATCISKPAPVSKVGCSVRLNHF
jgi:YidC/Oxa1 family membrane protein insertase